jgi:hypothetical protein
MSVLVAATLRPPYSGPRRFGLRAGGPAAAYLIDPLGRALVVADGWTTAGQRTADGSPLVVDGISSARAFAEGRLSSQSLRRHTCDFAATSHDCPGRTCRRRCIAAASPPTSSAQNAPLPLPRHVCFLHTTPAYPDARARPTLRRSNMEEPRPRPSPSPARIPHRRRSSYPPAAGDRVEVEAGRENHLVTDRPPPTAPHACFLHTAPAYLTRAAGNVIGLEAGREYHLVIAHSTDEDRPGPPDARLLQLAWRPAGPAGPWEGIPPASLAPRPAAGVYVTLYPVCEPARTDLTRPGSYGSEICDGLVCGPESGPSCI